MDGTCLVEVGARWFITAHAGALDPADVKRVVWTYSTGELAMTYLRDDMDRGTLTLLEPPGECSAQPDFPRIYFAAVGSPTPVADATAFKLRFAQ